MKLASLWEHHGSFWSVDGVFECIARVHVSLLFYENDDKNWGGMILYQLIDDQAELIYIFVSPTSRKKGIGRQLFDAMIKDIGSSSKPVRLNLEVRPSNSVAIHLYEKYGMNQSNVRPRYYSNGEDALIYQGTFDGSK